MPIAAISAGYKGSNGLMTTHAETGWIVRSMDMGYASSLFWWFIAMKGIAKRTVPIFLISSVLSAIQK